MPLIDSSGIKISGHWYINVVYLTFKTPLGGLWGHNPRPPALSQRHGLVYP